MTNVNSWTSADTVTYLPSFLTLAHTSVFLYQALNILMEDHFCSETRSDPEMSTIGIFHYVIV